MPNNILFDLRSGLQYFEPNTSDSYIQVDLQRQFYLHSIKFNSKTGIRFNLYRTEGIEQNFKHIGKYGGGLHNIIHPTISPSVKVRRIRIRWKESSFTLKLDLLGCPSEPFDGENPQCGTKSSFYHVTEVDKMYECVYKQCPLSKVTCGSYPHYYQTLSECNGQDECFSNPCEMGEICVQYKTNHKCYCLKRPCGKYMLDQTLSPNPYP
ncbi:uncharacterized protein LOC121384279 [Gigantopelta aegis]|uniref:uncharacterized protein LOC121384279 n=1 Tax=Gigantopelta aegis TaxID=1735272 RepID=UPI001B88DC41|nr:uncharacterized protein LOC121384279 [Gigantopelta aegis]